MMVAKEDIVSRWKKKQLRNLIESFKDEEEEDVKPVKGMVSF